MSSRAAWGRYMPVNARHDLGEVRLRRRRKLVGGKLLGHRVGQCPACRVLLAEHLDQGRQAAALLELGKEKFLLQLFVIVLDKLPHQRGGPQHRVGRHFAASCAAGALNSS